MLTEVGKPLYYNSSILSYDIHFFYIGTVSEISVSLAWASSWPKFQLLRPRRIAGVLTSRQNIQW